MLEAEVPERRLARVHSKEDRAARAAVAAVGSAAWHVRLTPEGRRAVPAVAGAQPDADLVEEHRGLSCAGSDRPGLARGSEAQKYLIGLMRYEPGIQGSPCQTSKWTCGPVALPDMPIRAMSWPRETYWPTDTRIEEKCSSQVYIPLPR